MNLNLFISERDLHASKLWEASFSDLTGVNILNCDFRELMALPGVDAVLMLGILAHERFGGKPQIGRSQVLSTHGKAGVPPWVVTTAAFPAHFEKRRIDGDVKNVLVPNAPMPVSEEIYIVFAKAFECIEEFNGESQNKIRTLGFDPKSLNMRTDSRDEIEAVRRAYIGFRS
jgi:hypothetical protein